VTRFRKLPRQFRLPWRSREQIRAEVDEELAFHLEMRTEELVRQGRSVEEARRQARREFGDVDEAKHSLREADEEREQERRRSEWLHELRSDLRFAVRSLRKSPAFTTVAVLTLAIGIGAATAVLTVADAFLLRPLPVRDQDRVVVLKGATRDGRFDNFPLLLSDARAFAEEVQSLERVEFFSSAGAHLVQIRDGSSVFRLRRTLVSGGYFQLLDTRPVLGRALRPEDDAVGAAPVVVLSHGAWQRYFGGDPQVVGRQLVMHGSGVAHRIVGVMPLGLNYPVGTDFWAPVMPNSKPLGDDPAYAELSVLGRLRPGASPADARAELTAYFGRPGAPIWHRDVHGVVHSLTNAILGDVRPAVLAFTAAAGLLLLITCINVANLLLVRGLARVREVAVRSALGAGRGRIVRQLVTESTLLAGCGGILGVGLAMVAVRGFLVLAPSGTPRLDEVHVSGTVIGGTVAITSFATLLFALAPALVTSRVQVQDTLRSGVRQSGTSRRFRLGTEALVVGQVALTLLVLSAAGLIARSLVKLERAELALEPSRLLFAELAMPYEGFGDTRQQLALLQDLLPRLEAIPGVRAVSPVFTVPFAGYGGISAQIPAEGQTEDEAARNPTVNLEAVTPNYFTTLGIHVLRGRGLSDRDREGAPPAAVISESAARHYWPGADPIGKRLKAPGEDGVTVVGVVPDTRYRDLRDPRPSVYVPLRQSSFPVVPTTLAIRAEGQPASLIPAIRRTIGEVDPGVALASAATFESYLGEQLVQPRLNALLLAAFALAALVLAAVGLYGVMATVVRQRTREIGVRMALGATATSIGRLVVRRGMAIAAAGTLIGLLGALAANRLLAALLFDIRPTDPPTLAIVAAVLLGVAVLASLIPARTSTRIEPAIALRAE
jgi:putative ABC transport system permease protein